MVELEMLLQKIGRDLFDDKVLLRSIKSDVDLAATELEHLRAEVERLRAAVRLRGIDVDRIARSCATYVETCHRQFSDLSMHEAMVAAVKVAIADALPDEIARAAGVE